MMNNNTKNADFLSALGIPASVILSYVTAICMLPSFGIVTSIPVSAILAVVASIFCKQRNIIYISMAVMPFINTLLMGYDMKRAVISSAIAVVSSFFALLVKRSALTIKKSENASARSKSRLVLAFSLILCIAVWLVCQGNPISFIKAEKDNKAVVRERYADKLETGATYFDVSSFEYLTEITFENSDPAKKHYISAKNTDDYKGYHMAETVLDAIDSFSGKTALAKDCIKCYISKDSFIFGDSSQNYGIAEYLIERTETVTGRTAFRDLYESLMIYAGESEDLIYKSIIMTAVGMDGRTYYAFKEYGKDAVMSVENTELEKEINKKFN